MYDDVGLWVAPEDANAPIVCDIVAHGDEDVYSLEDAANAQLLAASPDLKAALTDLWLWASERRTHVDTDPVPDGLGAQVLAALAKADVV